MNLQAYQNKLEEDRFILLTKAYWIRLSEEGWIMFYVVWKKGLERVIDNTGFVTQAKAKTYAIQELPTGWSFAILQFGKYAVPKVSV